MKNIKPHRKGAKEIVKGGKLLLLPKAALITAQRPKPGTSVDILYTPSRARTARSRLAHQRNILLINR